MHRINSYASPCAGLVLAILGSIAAPLAAQTGQGTFAVSVRVVPSNVERMAPADIPVPPGAQAMRGTGALTSYVFAGSPDEAARFYRDEMPRRGYRLVGDGGDGATWESPRHRLQVRLDPVPSARDLTRIVVTGYKLS